jgi:purine-binding chemotaxis protein CheW
MNKTVTEVSDVEDAQKGRYLTFRLDEEVFGIEIRHVTEIVGMQPVTKIPEVPVFVKGIINLRGKIIPVIDVRLKFRKTEKEYNSRTCVIVVDISEMKAGLIVDNVSEVLSITDEDIVNPPDYNTGFQNRYIEKIGKPKDGIKLLLNCEKLLTEEEFIEINESL